MIGAADDADRPGGPTGARGMADERTRAMPPLAPGAVDHARDETSSERRRGAELERRDQPALALPARASILDLTAEVVARGPVKDRRDLRTSEEEHIVRPLDGVGLDGDRSQAKHRAAQRRPAQRERTGLLFAKHRVHLSDLEQLIEAAKQPRIAGKGFAAPACGRVTLLAQTTVPGAHVRVAPHRSAFPGGRPEPVHAVDGVGGGLRFGSGQADEQLLVRTLERLGQVPSYEAREGTLDLPGRSSDALDGPQHDARVSADRIDARDELTRRGVVELRFRGRDRSGVARLPLVAPARREGTQ